jgi:hypothetical protein
VRSVAHSPRRPRPSGPRDTSRSGRRHLVWVPAARHGVAGGPWSGVNAARHGVATGQRPLVRGPAARSVALGPAPALCSEVVRGPAARSVALGPAPALCSEVRLVVPPTLPSASSTSSSSGKPQSATSRSALLFPCYDWILVLYAHRYSPGWIILLPVYSNCYAKSASDLEVHTG